MNSHHPAPGPNIPNQGPSWARQGQAEDLSTPTSFLPPFTRGRAREAAGLLENLRRHRLHAAAGELRVSDEVVADYVGLLRDLSGLTIAAIAQRVMTDSVVNAARLHILGGC